MRISISSWARLSTVVAACTFVAKMASAQSLVINGSFEDGGNSFQATYSTGSTIGAAGWTVVSGSVDVTNASIWASYDGSQSLDMAGSGPGAIKQSFATIAGSKYLVQVRYTATPFGDPNLLRKTDILWNDQVVQEIMSVAPSGSNMNYRLFEGQYTATSNQSSLGFAATVTAAQDGMVIDQVVVKAVPEPATLLTVGLGVIAFRRRQKLTK